MSETLTICSSPLGEEGGRSALPLVSVIVPVWNDLTGIEQCLAALQLQSYPNSKLQLIVVDNGSTDGSYERAQSFAGVTVLRELKPGSYAARNAGLRQAQGTYVAFLDSDCVPDRRWIEQAVTLAMRHSNLGVLAGRVNVAHSDRSSPSAAALYERMFSFNQKANAEGGTCITANWLSPKAVLDSFGGFDAALKSGGDSKLSREISQAGYPVLYSDVMIVHHPARATISGLISKRRRVVGGKWAVAPRSLFKPIHLAAVLTWDACLRWFMALRARNFTLAKRLQIVGIIAVVWLAGLGEVVRLTAGLAPRR
jgi:glycosyltransferase involved in cell wall biosynthesis